MVNAFKSVSSCSTRVARLDDFCAKLDQSSRKIAMLGPKIAFSKIAILERYRTPRSMRKCRNENDKGGAAETEPLVRVLYYKELRVKKLEIERKIDVEN